LVLATLVTHYWSNDGFLGNGDEMLRRASAIGHIPAVFIHGRRDIGSPVITAWRLHRLWPASRLRIVEAEGHGGPQSMSQMRAALDAFARQRRWVGRNRQGFSPPSSSRNRPVKTAAPYGRLAKSRQ
jgi:pimeloyl-ACP methyl ester carboxylesterase